MLFLLSGYTPVVSLFLVFSVKRVNKTFFFAIRFAIHVICAPGFGELHYEIIDITEDEQLVILDDIPQRTAHGPLSESARFPLI